MITEAIKRTTLALLCTASFALGHAQIQTIWGKAEIEVGGKNLRLGMTKAQVAEKLVGHEITKWHEDDWTLGPRQNPGSLLQFTGGVLTYAEREWTTGVNDVAEALFGAVGTLNDEGFSKCTVTADTRTSPGISSQRVWVECGEKSILIVRRSIGGKSFSSVDEHLGYMRELTK